MSIRNFVNQCGSVSRDWLTKFAVTLAAGALSLAAAAPAQAADPVPLTSGAPAISDTDGGQLYPGDTLSFQLVVYGYQTTPSFVQLNLSNMVMSVDLSDIPSPVTITSATPATICGAVGPAIGSTSFVNLAPMSIGALSTCIMTFTFILPDDIPEGVYTVATSDLTGTAYDTGGGTTTSFVIDVPDPTFTVVGDTQKPTATVGPLDNVIADAPFDTAVSFDEPVEGFDVSELVITNGVASNFVAQTGESGSFASVYTFTVTPSGPGALTIEVPADVATDAAGNTNVGATDSATVIDLADVVFSVLDSPVAPGGSTTLRVSITNNSDSLVLSSGGFSVNLGATVSGLTAGALPATPCGASSALTPSGASVVLSGAGLAASASCVFDIPVNVGGATATGNYLFSTNSFNYSLDATGVSSSITNATLTIGAIEGAGAPAVFSKAFSGDPQLPGGEITLTYTIVAPEGGSADSLAFSDSLATVLPSLEAIDTPLDDICGAGSRLDWLGPDLTFLGGSLPVDGSCTFAVTLRVPNAASAGTYASTSGALTGTQDIGGTVTALSLAAASDSFDVISAVPSATLSGPAGPLSGAFEVTVRFSEPVTGLELGDFSVTNGTPSDLTGVGSDYAITVTPAGLGAVSVELPADSVVDTDTNGNTISNLYSVSAVAAEPEINVTGLGASIASGTTIPVDVSGTRFGFVDVTSGQQTRTFTIQNTGTGDLTLTGGTPVTITGADLADFSVVAQPASPVAAGDSVTFQITYDPSAVAVDVATINIASDDADEAPYTFAITGEGVAAPEINITGNSVSIVDGDSSPSSADHTEFGSLELGSSIARTYTIENLGGAVLTLGSNAVSVANVGASVFTVTSQPATTVGIGSSTTFEVTYTPQGVGSDSAVINVANNDVSENPYNFAVSGAATGGPEVNMTGLGLTILDGDTTPSVDDGTNFGSSNTGAAVAQIFVIENTGTSDLTLSVAPIETAGDVTGTTTVDVFGSGDFSIISQPSTTIAAGASSSFTVLFLPSATGSISAKIAFGTDDPDEHRYEFSVSGTGTTPEIDITGESTSITSGDATPDAADGTLFTSVGVASGSDAQTFTITNSGTGPLTLGANAVSVTGSEFSVTSQPAASVGVGLTTTFEITFDPSSTGAKTSTVSVANDDTNESPYTFDIAGTGLDLTAPSGYSVTIDQDPINIANAGAVTVSFSGAEVGSTLAYELSDGATTVSDSAVVSAATGTLPAIDISFLADGTITLSATLTDTALNTGPEETATATKDTVQPTAVLSSTAGSRVGSSFSLDIVFSESITGFDTGDLTVANGAVQSVSGSGDTYSAVISAAADGALTVDLAAAVVQDTAGNDNTAATQFTTTADLTAPTVTLSSGSTDPVSGAFTLTVTFSEDVTAFTVGSLILSNATASDFSGSGDTYTVTITPTADGLVTVDLPECSAVDSTGNVNVAAPQFSISFDSTLPSVALSTVSPDPVSGAFTLDVVFSESVTGFTIGDLTVGNGAASAFAGTGTTYSATITPAGDGEVTVDVAADAAVDAAGNGNTAASQFAISADITVPTLAITGPATAQTGAFTSTFTFSESVSGFALGDISVGNGAASNLAGSGAVYTATITPAADGAVTVDVAANAATDVASNGNTAATQFSVTADINLPTVSSVIASDDRLLLADIGTPFTLTITFSEALDTAVEPELSFSGADLSTALVESSAAWSAGNTVYTITYDVADDGAFSEDVDVTVSGAADIAGNALASTEFTDVFSVDFRRGGIVVATSITGGIDGEFDFTGDLGAFTITTASQSGSSEFAGLEAGDYVITPSATDGFSLDEIACVGGTNTIDAETGATTVSLTAGDNVTCNFAWIADPAIDETIIPEVTLSLDATTEDPTGQSTTFALANTGGRAFTFTAATDVPWLVIDPTSGDIPAEGSLDFTITFTDAVLALEPGEYTATITITEIEAPAGKFSGTRANSLAVLQIPVTITLASREGTLTIIATTSPAPAGDGTFVYASSLAELDGLSLATSGGTASSAALAVPIGAYTLAQAAPEGWRLDSISCVGDTDSGSTYDLEQGSMVIDLDADESITCTFANQRDEDFVRMVTQSAIRSFMVARADQILTNTPDLSRRMRGSRTSATPNHFAADYTEGRLSADISTSLSAIRQAAESSEPQMPGQSRLNLDSEVGAASLDVWVQANYASVDDNRAGLDSSSTFGIYYLGVDMMASENLLIGALLQWDHAETVTGTYRSQVEGDGWLAGPYMVARLYENVYLDARGAWGRSDNTVDPLGLYVDDFETTRWLVEANVSGEISAGNWRITPRAGLAYFSEEQASYTDTLGFFIPSQEITLGRFNAGPEFAYRFVNSEGGYFEPYLRVTAVWDYDGADVYNAVGALQGIGGLRADARLGLTAEMANGGRISGEIGVMGVGEGEFEANNAMIRVRLPLSMH
tara:strand:+ start:47162 stop:54469 length:7308 start_codon:yes stop_codon:yes gene_type:complete